MPKKANEKPASEQARKLRAKRVRAPFVLSEDILEDARAVVFHFGEGLTMVRLGEEGLRLAVEKYRQRYEKERGRPVPPLPADERLARGPR